VRRRACHQHSTAIYGAVREWLLMTGVPRHQESDSETVFGEISSDVREADFSVLFHTTPNRITSESPTIRKSHARFEHSRILAIVDLPLGKT
jgi:hypothetical protein